MTASLQQNAKRAFDKIEIYLHGLILLAAIVVLSLSFSMNLVGPDKVYLPGSMLPLPESCSSRIWFGVDCPACGLTRAFISISRGQLSSAWHFNPASYLVYLFVWVQIPWQSYQIWRLSSGRPSVDELWLYYLPIATTIALILQWALRP